MCSGWDITPLLCISQVFSPDLCFFFFSFNFMFNFNVVTLISLPSVVSAFSCHALKILLHCNVTFTYVSYWLTALVLDLEIIKFIGNFLG